MIRATVLLLIFLVSAVARASGLKTLDFIFFDATGNEYHSVSLQEDIPKYHGIKSNPYILLVYAPSLNEQSLAQQESLLANLGAFEELQLLYVVACPSAEVRAGYYVPSSKAHQLTLKRRQFSVALIGAKGMLIRRWYHPISLKELRGLIPTTSNPALNTDAPQQASLASGRRLAPR